MLFGLAALLDGSGERLVRGLLAGAAVWLAFATLYKLPGEGLGRGDVKLSGLLGGALGWLGWPSVAAGLVLGVVLAGVWALVLLATRRAGRTDQIAYGPHLLAGTWIAILLSG
jgi:leader peptidase (prepilin peptidase)/N-methyltransferase